MSPTGASQACPPCCPCVCHVARPGLELRWVPVGGCEDGPRAPCRASPLRTSRSRPNPPSTSDHSVVLTSYRSTAERKLLPPLKPPKPTRVRQDASISGDPPQPVLDLSSEDGIQTGIALGDCTLWMGREGVEMKHFKNELQPRIGPELFCCCSSTSTSCCSRADGSCSFYSSNLCWGS